MAKKKKSQLKPVVRGFATTSVAKKVTPEVQNDADEDSTSMPHIDNIESSDSPANDAGSGQQNPITNGLSDEEKLLQSFVDKYQDRVEREVTRAVKVMQVNTFVFCSSLIQRKSRLLNRNDDLRIPFHI